MIAIFNVRKLIVAGVIAVVLATAASGLQAQSPAKSSVTLSSTTVNKLSSSKPVWEPKASTSATNPFQILFPVFDTSIFRMFSF